MKHPPIQMEEGLARKELERFISDSSRNIIIGHSRSKDNTQSGDYWSEYWSKELSRAYQKSEELRRHCEILTTEEKYHDNEELVILVEDGVERLHGYPNGYEKNIYVPPSVTERIHKERMIAALSRYPEINVWFINSEPDEEYLERIPNFRGYIGVDNFLLGQRLFDELTANSHESRVVVYNHEPNDSLQRRIEGIEDRAREAGIEVLVCESEERLREIVASGNVAGIGLGLRGAEMFINLNVPEGVVVLIVSVDLNKRVADAMANKNSNKKVLAVFTQNGMGENMFCGHTMIIEPVKVTA